MVATCALTGSTGVIPADPHWLAPTSQLRLVVKFGSSRGELSPWRSSHHEPYCRQARIEPLDPWCMSPHFLSCILRSCLNTRCVDLTLNRFNSVRDRIRVNLTSCESTCQFIVGSHGKSHANNQLICTCQVRVIDDCSFICICSRNRDNLIGCLLYTSPSPRD